MKILVPVDFYLPSFKAFQFASLLADTRDIELTLTHVVHGLVNTNDPLVMNPLLTNEQMADQRIEYFTEEYPKSVGLNLSKINFDKEVLHGIPGPAIVDFSTSKKFDLLILGVKSSKSCLDTLMGSTSSYVLNASETPLLVVHQKTELKKEYKKIILVVDNETDYSDILERSERLLNLDHASIDILYFNTNNVPNDESRIVEDYFQNTLEGGHQFKFIELFSKQKSEVLRKYCENNHSDLIIMMTKYKSILTRYFYDYKVLSIADDHKIPLLIFRK